MNGKVSVCMCGCVCLCACMCLPVCGFVCVHVPVFVPCVCSGIYIYMCVVCLVSVCCWPEQEAYASLQCVCVQVFQVSVHCWPEWEACASLYKGAYRGGSKLP